jgi:hypothetical protein
VRSALLGGELFGDALRRHGRRLGIGFRQLREAGRHSIQTEPAMR